MSRKVVKVYCQRNHRVGTVIADAAGLRIKYTAEVLHTTAIFGSSKQCTMHFAEDDVTEFNAYPAAESRPVTQMCHCAEARHFRLSTCPAQRSRE
jgi:hypothetical protein